MFRLGVIELRIAAEKFKKFFPGSLEAGALDDLIHFRANALNFPEPDLVDFFRKEIGCGRNLDSESVPLLSVG